MSSSSRLHNFFWVEKISNFVGHRFSRISWTFQCAYCHWLQTRSAMRNVEKRILERKRFWGLRLHLRGSTTFSEPKRFQTSWDIGSAEFHELFNALIAVGSKRVLLWETQGNRSGVFKSMFSFPWSINIWDLGSQDHHPDTWDLQNFPNFSMKITRKHEYTPGAQWKPKHGGCLSVPDTKSEAPARSSKIENPPMKFFFRTRIMFLTHF